MPFIIILILLGLTFFALQDKGVRAFFTKFGRHIVTAIASIFVLLLLGPARVLNFFFGIIVALLPFLATKEHSKPRQAKQYSDDEIADALEILELTGNVNKNDIEKAYRKLIKKHHPDKGGSKYFTRKIIKARQTLLNKIEGKNIHD